MVRILEKVNRPVPRPPSAVDPPCHSLPLAGRG
jgi:hypothetical protein